MEVINKFPTRYHDIIDAEKIPIIKNQLRKEGLQFIHRLTQEKQESCENSNWTILNSE